MSDPVYTAADLGVIGGMTAVDLGGMTVVSTTPVVAGMPGPPGPPGPPGSGYIHVQTEPAAQWTITHNLGRSLNPTVLLDDMPEQSLWVECIHPDSDTTLVILPEPHAGVANF